MDDLAAPPDSRQEKKAHSRARILHEAAAAIRSEGAERVSVQAVMARAGMTVGGFYAHFASKDDLLGEAITRMFAERYASYFTKVEDQPPQDALRALVGGYLSMRHRDAPDRGCPIPPLAAEVNRLAPPVREAFVSGMDGLTRAIAALLAKLGHLESDALAASILAEMAGAISLARVQPDETKAAEMLAASRERIRQRVGLSTDTD